MREIFVILILSLLALACVRVCWTVTCRVRSSLRRMRESRVRIHRDGMICIRCGYNMRASPQRCSECGYEPGSPDAAGQNAGPRGTT